MLVDLWNTVEGLSRPRNLEVRPSYAQVCQKSRSVPFYIDLVDCNPQLFLNKSQSTGQLPILARDLRSKVVRELGRRWLLICLRPSAYQDRC